MAVSSPLSLPPHSAPFPMHARVVSPTLSWRMDFFFFFLCFFFSSLAAARVLPCSVCAMPAARAPIACTQSGGLGTAVQRCSAPRAQAGTSPRSHVASSRQRGSRDHITSMLQVPPAEIWVTESIKRGKGDTFQRRVCTRARRLAAVSHRAATIMGNLVRFPAFCFCVFVCVLNHPHERSWPRHRNASESKWQLRRCSLAFSVVLRKTRTRTIPHVQTAGRAGRNGRSWGRTLECAAHRGVGLRISNS